MGTDVPAEGQPLILEVHQHLDIDLLRTIALHPVAGVRRGLPVHDPAGRCKSPCMLPAWDAC